MAAREITLALGGRWHGRYGLAFCPAHPNTRTPALSLADGDDGRLLARCHAGCRFEDVVGALRGLGLGGAGGPPAPDPEREARRAAEAREARLRDVRRARAIWDDAGPIAGTLAERYLRARAIRGALPPSLRFHPDCFHGPTARRLPAMVAAVEVEGEDGVVAVHRTFLAEPGSKASVEPVKMMLGPVAGGAVRLRDGRGPLVVAEGIEDALSVAEVLRDERPQVWAALSANGMATLRLPDGLRRLVVAHDADPPGRDAAGTLATRAWAAGWSVEVMPPPDGFKDWNAAVAGVAGVAGGSA